VFAITGVGTMYTTAMQHYRKLLSSKVGKEAWQKGRLGELIAWLDYDKFKKTGIYSVVKGSKLPGESVIHLVRDFKSGRGAEIDIPILRPLTNMGVGGVQRLKGTGEKRKIFNQKLAINMRRHAVVVRETEMDELVLTNKAIQMAMLENAGGDLRDWFSRVFSFEGWYSLLCGYAHHLWDSGMGLGTGYAQKSHPNFYVQGNGQVAWSTDYTFDTGYEVNVATALAGLTDTSDDHFKLQSIRNIVYLSYKHKIQPITYKGVNAVLVAISSAQARQLKEDTEWQAVYKEAGARTEKNPLFTGGVEQYLIEGCYLFVDDTIPAALLTGDTGFSATYSTNGLTTGPQYFRTDFLENPRDTGARKLAVALGAGAILAGEGKGFRFTEEIDDHDQWHEQGGRMIYGMSRADIIDSDNYMGNGAGLFYGNHSSLVYATYSPDTITI